MFTRVSEYTARQEPSVIVSHLNHRAPLSPVPGIICTTIQSKKATQTKTSPGVCFSRVSYARNLGVPKYTPEYDHNNQVWYPGTTPRYTPYSTHPWTIFPRRKNKLHVRALLYTRRRHANDRKARTECGTGSDRLREWGIAAPVLASRDHTATYTPRNTTREGMTI